MLATKPVRPKKPAPTHVQTIPGRKVLKLLNEKIYIDEDFEESHGFWLLDTLHQRYAKEAKTIWQGRNRTVFDKGRYVVKVPRNFNGIADNDWEGSVSNGETLGDPNHVQYARTRMFYWHDIPVVLMEKVEHANQEQTKEYLGTPKGKSDWTWSVDCGQVGFNRQGRLVAYDYGIR